MTGRADAPLRIGMIGAGMISRYHLRAWRQCERTTVVAIADPATAAATDRAAEFAVPQVYASAADMLAAGGLDAVDILAPMEHHAALCRTAASAGLPVICQKPLCPTLEEARALVDEIAGRVPFMVHENWRFRPQYRRLRQWIEQGRLGRVRAFTMEVMSSGLIRDRAGEPPPALRRQAFFAGMTRLTVLENLIHQLDTLRFLLDGVRTVGARTARLSDDVIGEDTAAILLESGDGAIGTLTGCMTVPGLPPRSGDALRVIGDRATAEFRDWVLVCSDDGLQERFDPEAAYQDSFDAVIEHFVDALSSGAPFETDARDNLETLALVEAVYRNAA